MQRRLPRMIPFGPCARVLHWHPEMRSRTALAVTTLLTLVGNAAIAVGLWLTLASATPPEPTRQALSIGRIRHLEPPSMGASPTNLVLVEPRRTSALERTLPDPETESDREPTAAEAWFQLTGHRPGERDSVPNAMAAHQAPL